MTYRNNNRTYRNNNRTHRNNSRAYRNNNRTNRNNNRTYRNNNRVPITSNVNSIPVQGEVYSIQHYVIKFVSELPQVVGFLCVVRFPPPIKNKKYSFLLNGNSSIE
jgi:hypothetical protein